MRWYRLGSVVVALALVVLGCGDDDSGGDSAGTPPPEVPEPGSANVVLDSEELSGTATCGSDPDVSVSAGAVTVTFDSGDIDTDSSITVTGDDGVSVESDPGSHTVAIEGIPSTGTFAAELTDGRSLSVAFACADQS